MNDRPASSRMNTPPARAILFLRSRCQAPTHNDSPFSTVSGASGLVVGMSLIG